MTERALAGHSDVFEFSCRIVERTEIPFCWLGSHIEDFNEIKVFATRARSNGFPSYMIGKASLPTKEASVLVAMDASSPGRAALVGGFSIDHPDCGHPITVNRCRRIVTSSHNVRQEFMYVYMWCPNFSCCAFASLRRMKDRGLSPRSLPISHIFVFPGGCPSPIPAIAVQPKTRYAQQSTIRLTHWRNFH